MKLFLCLLLVGVFFLNSLCSEDSEGINSLESYVQDHLTHIPAHEHLVLEKFFQVLIKSDGLGYVLYGTKPVCLSAYFVTVPLGNMLRGCNSNAIKQGWKVWKKYEKYFPHPRYLIFEEKANVEGTDICTIYFMNKSKVLNILQQHQHLFEQELARNFDSHEFLDKIEKKQALLEVLNHHEGLLGILLGYGVESSMNYYKRDLVWKCGLPITYEEADFQAVSVSSFDKSFIQTSIQPIHFAGNPNSPEVKAILEQNTQERTFLTEIYSQGRFLEITLKKLTEQ